MGYILTSKEELQVIIRETVVDMVTSGRNELQERNQSPLDDLLNVKEAADYLHLSVATVYTHTSKKQIPFLKKGKKIYFKKEDLLKWMETGRYKETIIVPGQLTVSSQANNEKSDYVHGS